ncbi:MAG: hypothetical protein NVS4B6_28040 [Mycobacterium sp.]
MSQNVPFRSEDADAVRVGEEGPERRQRSDAALNRAKIIDTARRLLADDQDPTMREIAAAAGVGRGTVHRHFPTRDDLMDAVRRQARELATRLGQLGVPNAEAACRTLVEIGAADFSGTGAALGAVTQIGPIVTVLVIAGAGATAMCADLGARTIREEIDALKVLGINPVQALVVPRVLAATLVSLMLTSVVTMVGIIGSFVFSVFFQHVTPGAFAAGLTLLVGSSQVIINLIKAAIFGLAASLIACYKGLSVGGGPQGVGDAVNETVVYTFMALFVINVIATAVAVKATFGT